MKRDKETAEAVRGSVGARSTWLKPGVNEGAYGDGAADEMAVNRARKRVAAMKKFRWFMLAYGLCFLAMTFYGTVRIVTRLESLDERQLTIGFVYGVALGITWVTFALLGGLCIGKFLAGFQRDYREAELLVRYHDRLRGLGELPR